MALLYKKTANYSEAENLYLQSVAIYKLQIDEYYHDYAQSLIDLASLYVIIDKNSEAEALLTEAINILKNKPGDIQLSYAGFLNELAILYQNLGNYAKAEPLYLESSEIYKKTKGESHESYAQSLNNLASLYEIKEDYAKAEKLYNQALEIKKRIYGDNHTECAVSLDNLASLYVKMQNYSKASAMLIKAATIFKSKKGENHPDYAISLLKLADLNQQMGHYNESETQYLQALAIFQKVYGTEHSDYTNTINMLASLYEAMGKYSKAEPLYKQTNELYNKQIKQNFGFMSETEKELFLKTINDNFDIYHSFALRYKSQKPDFVCLNYNNELAHKGMILKSNILLQQKVMKSDNNELKTLYNELINTKKSLSVQYVLPIDKRTENTDSLENIANELEKSLNIQTQKLPEFKLMQQYYASPTWTDIQKSLKTNEVAIEFIRFYYRNEKTWTDSIYYCALVLGKEYNYPKMVYLCEERELINCMSFTSDNSNSIDDFYSLNGSKNNKGESGYLIYKLIWQPIGNLLKGVHTIYFAPSGLLHKISFNAISMPDGKYLSDLYKLHKVSSTSVIGSKDKSFSTGDGNSSVIYGGINYSTSIDEMLGQSKKIITKSNQNITHLSISESKASTRGMAWNYLPGTLKEATGISNLFAASKLKVSTLSGTIANEESFKALGGSNSPTIIHIATHGFFFPDEDKEYYKKSNKSATFQVSENPLLRSGLLFSGANAAWNNKNLPPELEDGILTAQEISQINLSNTKLVVLSACETGLGEIKGGEGVFGLQRSFKMAGVDYILMSLWQVPDEQTSELMQIFYKNLLKGKPVREAFTSAQNEIKDKYRDNPFLWAAFVLIN